MPGEASAPSGVGWYVYGVVEANAASPAGEGVSPRVATLTEGRLTALVSRVDLDEFGEEPVRVRLEDPLWLEEKARAHEAVLAAALRSGAVVPFRFLTVYRDTDEVRGFLAAHGAELGAVLDRLRGTVELGVKAFVDRAALERSVAGENAAVAHLDAEIAAAQAGRAYLLRQRREQAAREEAARLLQELADDSHARLLAVAEGGVANPVQPRELSGRPEAMVLNGAYLVRAGDDRLRRKVAALGERYGHLGVTFEQTGPWPPYNFVPQALGER